MRASCPFQFGQSRPRRVLRAREESPRLESVSGGRSYASPSCSSRERKKIVQKMFSFSFARIAEPVTDSSLTRGAGQDQRLPYILSSIQFRDSARGGNAQHTGCPTFAECPHALRRPHSLRGRNHHLPPEAVRDYQAPWQTTFMKISPRERNLKRVRVSRRNKIGGSDAN